VEIAFAIERAALGWVLLASTAKGLCSIQLGDGPGALRRDLEADFPNATLREDRSALSAFMVQVVNYLASATDMLWLPLDIRGTAFQQRVWSALQRIPAGKTSTYSKIARAIGHPKAVRAVASACAANPVALAIPCHRVVRSDGGLGGYRWDVTRKRALLAVEAKACSGKVR